MFGGENNTLAHTHAETQRERFKPQTIQYATITAVAAGTATNAGHRVSYYSIRLLTGNENGNEQQATIVAKKGEKCVVVFFGRTWK